MKSRSLRLRPDARADLRDPRVGRARCSTIPFPIISAHASIVVSHPSMEAAMGRGILLFLLGVPIPIIILLALLFR
jgi:hypothetical protein